MKSIKKRDKILYGLLALSVVLMIFGALFLVNAMGIADFYPNYAGIDNALAKYIVVILTMASGIMLFSNVALNFEDKKLRNGLTIFITTFAFVLTLPLTYVFFSLMPFAAEFSAEQVIAAGGVESMSQFTPEVVASSADVLGINAVDKLMGVNNIYLGFADWFGEGAGLWVVLSVMMILGIVFLLEPLIAGICVTKGKFLQLFGKTDGKFKVIDIVELPVLKKLREIECASVDSGADKCEAQTESDGAQSEQSEELADAAADVE